MGVASVFLPTSAFPGSEPGNDFVPRLWASRRVGDLTRQIRLEGATPDLIAQVRDLGLRYGILTEYTSYLVQEPMAVAAGGLRRELAAPPAAQSGRAAFDAASRSAALSGAGNLAAAKASEVMLAPDESTGVRRAGGDSSPCVVASGRTRPRWIAST